MAQSRPKPGRRPTRTMQVRIGAWEYRLRGAARYEWRDPYHTALSVGWPAFLLALLCCEVGINFAFAALYFFVPGSVANAAPGSFADAFFFSIETWATVGYGGMAPATLYGHIIATIEIFCGMAFTALATGIIFVRFSRPHARFLYAEHPVVATMNGRPTLMVRVANGRASLLADARATLSVMLEETTEEGFSFRRSYDLPLVRSRLPIFPLTWTVMHELLPSSPLHGFDAADLVGRDARLFLTMIARDPALSAEVHDSRDYPAASIRFNTRYADAVVRDEQGQTYADLTLIGALEPITEPGVGA